MNYDLVIIGSGPAGEVGAIRATQLGMKVAVVEKSSYLGGTCLNVGCIPTKALLEVAKTYDKLQKAHSLGLEIGQIKINWPKVMKRKDVIVESQRKGLRYLMKKNGIDVYQGTGEFSSSNTLDVVPAKGNKQTLSAKNFLIATGSQVRKLSFIPSNSENILTSDSVLSIDHIPKSLAIIGGGVVGIEFASLFSRLGSQVCIIELASQILPTEDQECVTELTKYLMKFGVKIKTDKKLTKINDEGGQVQLVLDGEENMRFEKMLLCVGRKPALSELRLHQIGLEIDREFLRVNDHYQTKQPHIYAVGDVITTPGLAHTAAAEAFHAVEHMAGKQPQIIDYKANPSAIYAYPEIASIGLTESSLKKQGTEYGVAKFPFFPMAKAKIEQSTEGFIKILYSKKYREILGVHIVGAKATELIAEFSLAKILESTVDELALTIHPHPTISETVMETAHVAMGGAIHI